MPWETTLYSALIRNLENKVNYMSQIYGRSAAIYYNLNESIQWEVEGFADTSRFKTVAVPGKTHEDFLVHWRKLEGVVRTMSFEHEEDKEGRLMDTEPFLSEMRKIMEILEEIRHAVPDMAASASDSDVANDTDDTDDDAEASLKRDAKYRTKDSYSDRGNYSDDHSEDENPKPESKCRDGAGKGNALGTRLPGGLERK